jgi:hypothetical protein
MNTSVLVTRAPKENDIDIFTKAHVPAEDDDQRAHPEQLRAYLSECLKRSTFALCVLDGASQPVALFGCIPLPEGHGAVWVHLTKHAEGVPLPALQEAFSTWTKTEAVEHSPLLLAGPTLSATHMALLHAAGFVLMEPEEDTPSRVMAFRRASRDPSPLRMSEVRSVQAA